MTDSTGCDDGDICTAANCVVGAGCQSTIALGPCDDDNACTTDACTAQPSCPDGTQAMDGRCYLTFTLEDPVSWDDARQSCLDAGADLVTVDDETENMTIRAAIDEACGAGVLGFIGLSYAAPSYSWSDGTAVDYLNLSDPGHGDGGAWMAGRRHVGPGEATPSRATCASYRPARSTCENVLVDPDDPIVQPEICNGADDDCNGTIDDHDPDDPLCDDGDACTVDVCGGAEGCLGDPQAVVCDDGIDCTVDSCDSATGCVATAEDASCTDGIDCTTDVCDPVGGCTSTPDDAACDDGQDCNTRGVRRRGWDASTRRWRTPVTTGSDCTDETCEPQVGCVYEPVSARCDDGNTCTSDACVVGVGCEHAHIDVACDDGNACTLSDNCVDGVCVGSVPPVCDDETVCTADQCDPAVGCIAPFESDCDSPGPVGGYYEGTVSVVGSIEPTFSFLPSADYVCEGSVSAVVDRLEGPRTSTGPATSRACSTSWPTTTTYRVP